MWRNNVLRLRNCSSVRPIRHGLCVRCYSSAGLPVSDGEFEAVLTGLLMDQRAPDSNGPIGFAISGGVDSMALAALYTTARQSNTALPNAHGFIVDHRVRPESTEEAEWVAEQLRQKFGMQASVLPLTWPAGFNVLDHTRFETDARLLRYQALGHACRANNISHLMVAHHADDQAETVLMRLMKNRLRSGLRGMQSVEWIPECHGLYGVHHSGQQQGPDANRNLPFPIEKGGIQIVRPLLGFEKSRLIATCETLGVAWAEDKTNHIQTYTSRNAIRHVYKNHELPAALSIQSLVNVALAMKRRMDGHKAYARMLFDKCLIKLDMQTGSMIVRLPPYTSLLDCEIETTANVNEAKNNAYYLLERVADLVTPRTKAPISQLAATIENIWPEFRDSEGGVLSETGAGQADKAYCVYGIWWRWWNKPSPFEQEAISAWGFAKQPPHPREWLLMRQPPSISEDKANVPIEYPPSRIAKGAVDSHYRLFDGRYWIRIQNHTDDTLVLRFFSKKDMRHVPAFQKSKAHQGPRPERFIGVVFGQLQPKDVRFTLPAVFRVDSATGEESLVGFPTLGVSMNTAGAPVDVCEWDVRYKKIDTGGRKAEDIVVPGISHAIVNGEKTKKGGVGGAHKRSKRGIAKGKGRVADDSMRG